MTDEGGIAVQIAGAIGQDLADRLLAARGGTEITIPQHVRGSLLAEVIGEDAARLLRLEFGAGKLRLPTGHMRGEGGRRRRAKQMLEAGHSISEVAQACGLHSRTVEKYRAKMRDDGDQLDLFPDD